MYPFDRVVLALVPCDLHLERDSNHRVPVVEGSANVDSGGSVEYDGVVSMKARWIFFG